MSNSRNIELVEVRFGRNIDGAPMSAEEWAKFQAFALDPLTLEAARIRGLDDDARAWVEIHTGTGTWVGDDGIPQSEESAVATLFTNRGAMLGDTFRTAEAAAYIWGQEVVAVVVCGVSHEVRATDSALYDEDTAVAK